MKPFFIVLFSGSILFCNAQQTKSIKIDPKKAAEIGTKMKETHPKPVPVTKVQKTTTVTTTKTTTTTTETVSAANAKPFQFTGSFILNYDDKNKDDKYNTGKIKYALDGLQAAIIPTFSNLKDIKMRSLVDMKEKEMTMLTIDAKGKKNGLLMKYPKPVLKKIDPKAKLPVVKKTGETKMIQGFKCEKITIQTDTTQIEAWITNEIIFDMSELIGLSNAGFKGKSPFSNTNVSDIKGTALEAIITQKNGAVLKMNISEIKKGKPEVALFSSEGFKIADVRGLPMFVAQ